MAKFILKIVLAVIVILIVAVLYFYFQFKPAAKVNFGLTFSHTYAKSLGFDPKVVYLDMLNDLQPKKLRLMTYWNEIEPTQGRFDFQIQDELLLEAGKRGIEVVLVVGKKQPRWPECHLPDWYKNLDANKQQEAVEQMLRTTVEHFKQFDAITTWQVENEPYFVFGIDCPKQTKESVSKEIEIVKSIDDRPVMLTDSGEQGNWNYTAKTGADVLGVTMYRTVYNDKLGYYKYPVGPWFYRIKAGFLQQFTESSVVGIELQAEPWLLSGIFNTDVPTQLSLMNPKIFEDNVEYARKTGFVDNYLWGVEWWYWLAKDKNDWGMWGKAKDLLNE